LRSLVKETSSLKKGVICVKRRRKTLLVIAISLICIAIVLAILAERAINAVLPPQMVKEMLQDEEIVQDLNDILNEGSVENKVYKTLQDDQNQVKVGTYTNTSKEESDSKTKTSENIEKSTNNVSSKPQSNTQGNKSQNVQNDNNDKNTNSEIQLPNNIKITSKEQLEIAKIVLSVVSIQEIKELYKLYESGQKDLAISKAKEILKQRLKPEQKERVKKILGM